MNTLLAEDKSLAMKQLEVPGLFNSVTTSIALRLVAGFVLAVSIFPVYRIANEDFKAFKALGPGGTPSTFAGYLRVKLLSLFALRDPYEPAPIPDGLRYPKGHLDDLPARHSPRPKTKGIAPHRQITQRAERSVYEKLAAAIEEMARHSGDRFKIGTSCFEKHGTGLFSTSAAKRTCRGEICHAHPSDGSLHLTLHPADAKILLDAGWGERHPISRGGIFERVVPKGFLMVYAPRDEQDIGIVLRVIEAAAWYISGESVSETLDEGMRENYHQNSTFLS